MQIEAADYYYKILEIYKDMVKRVERGPCVKGEMGKEEFRIYEEIWRQDAEIFLGAAERQLEAAKDDLKRKEQGEL